MRSCRPVLLAVFVAVVIMGSPLSPSQSFPAVVLAEPSAVTQRATAVVMVNSDSANYADFQRYLQPYLDNFGVPYTVLNIATSSVESNIQDYAVVIIGHRRLDINHTYLDSTEEANITTAVNAGTGLVNFDNDLAVGGSTPRYQFVQNIFGFSYLTPPTASGVNFTSAAHYITERHAAGESISTGTMTLAGITLPASATALATSGAQPFLAVTTSGAGRAVQWGTYNWMSHTVKGPMYGLDDLVWRSIVWAARKPFVMQGMPPLVTMRIDDVTGPMDWIHIANEVGIKPWVGIFLNNIDEAEASDLAALSQEDSATIGIHAFTDPYSFYYNQYNGNYPDAVMADHYVTGTRWFTSHNITPSTFVTFHHYEVGSNAFGGLSNWGVQFVATHQPPGQPEWYPNNVGWLQLGPYRLYESGLSTSTTPVYYADYLPIPGHPEYDQQFFNCVTEVRDEQYYEWIPSNDVAASVLHGTRQLQRGLDGMAVPTLFAHQYNMVNISNANWRAIMQGIASNIAPYQPMYVTMDYACQYVRAVYTSNITASLFDSASRQITTTLSGQTDMTTKFYLFTEQNGQIQQGFVNVPAFNGSTQVVATFGPGKLNQTITFNPLPPRTYGDPPFTAAATATSGLPVTFTVGGGGCGVSGSTVTIMAAGVCAVTAHQSGNAIYAPAPSITQTFAINKATPVITWSNPADIVYGTPLGGTQLNAEVAAAGNKVYTPGAGTLLNAGVGRVLRVDFTPVDATNYTTATKTVAITVTKATPVITWSNPADIVYGTPLGGTQLNAEISAAGNKVYTPGAGTLLNAGAGRVLRVDFTPVDATNYTTATTTVAITVTKATQSIMFGTLPDKSIGDPPFVVTATATSGLDVTFTVEGDCRIAGSTITLLKSGSCTVTGQQAGNANYNPAPDVVRAFAIQRVKLFLPLLTANSR